VRKKFPYENLFAFLKATLKKLNVNVVATFKNLNILEKYGSNMHFSV